VVGLQLGGRLAALHRQRSQQTGIGVVVVILEGQHGLQVAVVTGAAIGHQGAGHGIQLARREGQIVAPKPVATLRVRAGSPTS
jgi:hypothetical protein